METKKLTRKQMLKKIMNLIDKRFDVEELQEYLENLEITLHQEGYD